jgi:hypothetical protein
MEAPPAFRMTDQFMAEESARAAQRPRSLPQWSGAAGQPREGEWEVAAPQQQQQQAGELGGDFEGGWLSRSLDYVSVRYQRAPGVESLQRGPPLLGELRAPPRARPVSADGAAGALMLYSGGGGARGGASLRMDPDPRAAGGSTRLARYRKEAERAMRPVHVSAAARAAIAARGASAAKQRRIELAARKAERRRQRIAELEEELREAKAHGTTLSMLVSRPAREPEPEPEPGMGEYLTAQGPPARAPEVFQSGRQRTDVDGVLGALRACFGHSRAACEHCVLALDACCTLDVSAARHISERGGARVLMGVLRLWGGGGRGGAGGGGGGGEVADARFRALVQGLLFLPARSVY